MKASMKVDGRGISPGRGRSWIGCLAAAVAALTAVLLWAPAAIAAPGDLDPSFSDDGTLTTDFAARSDAGRAVALQADGKIVVAGSSYGDFGGSSYGGSYGDFALTRYNADGTLDSSFSGDGKQTTDFGGGGGLDCLDSSAGPDTAAADSQQASPRRRGQRQDLPMGLAP